MTEGQSLGLEQLNAIAAASAGTFEVLGHSPGSGRDTIIVEIAVSCRGIRGVPAGIHVRAREEFLFYIPADFPFRPPLVSTRHRRFAGYPHLQWGRQLCLYAAPSVEWDVSDGMYGLVVRLHEWLRAAAADELDPEGAPLHPPVAYTIYGPGHAVVVRANAPSVMPPAWYGMAHLQAVTPMRVEVRGWSDIFSPDRPSAVAAAVLLSQPMPFEYPSTLRELLSVLETRDVPREMLMLTLRAAAMSNERGSPLYVVLGAPMRGIRGSGNLRQHLSVWHIEATLAGGLRASLSAFSSDPLLRELGQEVLEILWRWTEGAKVGWCHVYEARSEVTERRDSGAATEAFRGKAVSVWGCGALGSHVAEWLARSDARRIVLRDNGCVSPGVLVRQGFEELDIGRSKSEALADRLRLINPWITVEAYTDDLLQEPLARADWNDGVEIIIDTAASAGVLAKLEQRRREPRRQMPVLVSLAVDARAVRGVVAIAAPDHTGGPFDILRAAKIAACNQSELTAYADAFWRIRQRPFFPEPGCSAPTFMGSASDVAGLASSMLNAAAFALSDSSFQAARAHFVSRPEVTEPTQRVHARIDIPRSVVIEDPSSGYTVRISGSAWKEIRAWIARSTQRSGVEVETGGALFGESDDSLKIVWIDEVLGPPPDSEASATGFVCGIEGLCAAGEEKAARIEARFVGLWHTHPGGPPIASPEDLCGMRQVVTSKNPNQPKALMLIVGGEAPNYRLGARIFSRADIEAGTLASPPRVRHLTVAGHHDSERTVGLALSGGGSRAIAFHLGCLRALHNRDVLDRVRVISAVSGGAVIAGMYAYGSESFREFDQRVVELLRRGLVGSIMRYAFASPLLLGALGTWVVSGTAAVAADALRTGLGVARLGPLGGVAEGRERIQPPLRRWISRTTAFEKALRHELFSGIDLTRPRRNGLDVVFNACELRSGSAFRFGSRESGCWRYGRLRDNQLPVSLAVAASAAYPVLLPALDLEFAFVRRDGSELRQRVVLTDGGVYDNLGVTCLEPDRSTEYSYNVFPVEYVICCDAGHGLFDTQPIPYWWGPRLVRTFESVFRKAENAGQERLHRLVQSGTLKGFILSYLGQQDAQLPYIPPDLVPRKAVHGYPTDFAPMRVQDLERLTGRGERLTRMLIERYCPEL